MVIVYYFTNTISKAHASTTVTHESATLVYCFEFSVQRFLNHGPEGVSHLVKLGIEVVLVVVLAVLAALLCVQVLVLHNNPLAPVSNKPIYLPLAH